MFRIHVAPKIRLAEGDRNTQKTPSSPFELYPLGVLYIVGKQHLEEGSRWERLLRSFQSLLPADLNEIPKAVSEKKWLNCLIFFSVCVGTFALSLCFRPPHSWSLLFAWAYPVFHSCKRSALFHWDKVILTHAEQFLHFESSVFISGEIPLFPPFPVVR